MITLQDMLKGKDIGKIDPSIVLRMEVLCSRINAALEGWNKQTIVTSGLRLQEEHIEIYKKIAIKKGIPFDINKVPMHSKHLTGDAGDIFDKNLELTYWLKQDNSKRLVENNLWCEEGNKDWVHFQCVPPKSGKRWFLS